MTARIVPDAIKNILVMGAGLIGSRHVATVMAHPGCRLAGIVDHAEIAADDTPVFRDMGDVDVPVDGAIIATPTDLHATHGQMAAERGWHILIEKPVATTPQEAAVLEVATKQHNVQCLVGHHRRYHPSVQQLRDIVQSGQIGAPITSTLIWAMRKPDSYFQTTWRVSGGSPVMINLVHDIDLLRFIFGEVSAVCALGSDGQRQGGRIESGGAILKFGSGVCGAISFADTTPSPWGFEAATAENPNIASTGQDMWWITGTKGGVSFPSLTLWGGADDWSQSPKPQVIGVESTTPLMAQLSHFVDVMDGAACPIIDIADAAKSLKVTRDIEDLLTPTPTPGTLQAGP